MERVQHDGQWPSAAMQAKLILLPKSKDANSIGDTRPITVLGCLNRLFSRFISSSVIPSWSQWFPEGISCGLQGRGVNDITLDAQDRLEKCLAERISFGGFVLDLRKAFNFVGRQLAHKVLCRLGVPRAASLTWKRSLYDLQRWPVVGGRRHTFNMWYTGRRRYVGSVYARHLPAFPRLPQTRWSRSHSVCR